MDGVHPSHAVRFVGGWIRKGRRVEIPTGASQKRMNLLGALNLESMTLNRKDYLTLNADAVIDFLAFLLVTIPTGILHIILDRDRYQYCQAVWDFVVKNSRITLHYLPSYSPNLNAIEPAWKIMHEHTTAEFLAVAFLKGFSGHSSTKAASLTAATTQSCMSAVPCIGI